MKANINKEHNVLIKKLIPKLKKLGYGQNYKTYFTIKDGKEIDCLIYDGNNNPLCVIELKSPEETKTKKTKALNQGIAYALSEDINAPLVIATDLENYFKAVYVKGKADLKDEKGKIIKDFVTYPILQQYKKTSNLSKLYAKKEDVDKLILNLNQFGYNLGLTAGIPRILELSKFLFIKILCDRQFILNNEKWDSLKRSASNIEINSLLKEIRTEHQKLQIEPINLSSNNKTIIKNILKELDKVDFSRLNYDIVGNFYESFLSERASKQGGGK